MTTNGARQISVAALNRTIAELFGREDTSEKAFTNVFLQHVRASGKLYDNGWYDPPPHGVSVLFANAASPSRISFESLRQGEAWLSAVKADWNDLLLFFYASACPLSGGSIGDVAITLYFGNDPKLVAHYQNCINATRRLLQEAKAVRSSQQLFERSLTIFAEAGLLNTVISKTDSVSLDLGHSFPQVPVAQGSKILSTQQIEDIRTSRYFLNAVSDWPLDGEFSIEPQLRSRTDASLPQITFHYRMIGDEPGISVDPDIDELIARWMKLD